MHVTVWRDGLKAFFSAEVCGMRKAFRSLSFGFNVFMYIPPKKQTTEPERRPMEISGHSCSTPARGLKSNTSGTSVGETNWTESGSGDGDVEFA